MEIKISCPNCQQHLALDESWRGRPMECPSCHSSFRVPGAFRTEGKKGAGKNIYILWGVIGLLVLTNALAIIFWKNHEQKTTPPVRKVAKRIVASTTSSPQPSPDIAAVMQKARTAVTKGDLPLLKQLLDAHPEIVNQRYGNASNALLISAVLRGKEDIVAEMLNRKADVNIRNSDGRTPLYVCIEHGWTKEMAALLLDHGADFKIADNNGTTPLKLAIEKTRQDIVDLLQQRGAKE
jgi:Ankyrin repeats (3 copies)